MQQLPKLSTYVDSDRLWKRHELLGEIGAIPSGGVNRQALTEEEITARRQLIDWAHALDLSVVTDDIANLFFRLEGLEPDAAPIMTGSHIDSQPVGGKYDGVFGVLAGLEVMEAIRAGDFQPRRPVELVVWTNEEGCRFAPGMMGSKVYCGLGSIQDILAVTDEEGISVASAVAAAHAAVPDLDQRQFGAVRPAVFLEAHIEQGPLLERWGIPIGAVAGIQGVRRFRIRVTGEPAHAGTTPRSERRDALLAATHMITAMESLTAEPKDVMCTVGMMRVKPNAPSVVPQEAFFSVDLRHPDNYVLTQMGDAVEGICKDQSGNCTVEVNEIDRADSLEFPAPVVDTFVQAAEGIDLPVRRLASMAGHDSRQLHTFCPTGMLFIPCKDGVSHSKEESVNLDDMAAGARVLADTIWKFANG